MTELLDGNVLVALVLKHHSYLDVPCDLIAGHRQVTDAWLAELAHRRGGKVATLDAAFATLHPKWVNLVPVI